MAGSGIEVTPDTLEQLGKFCKEQGESIGRMSGTINSRVGSSGWKSDASKAFDRDWTGHKENLKKLQESLDSLGAAAIKMADNYRRADQAYKG